MLLLISGSGIEVFVKRRMVLTISSFDVELCYGSTMSEILKEQAIYDGLWLQVWFPKFMYHLLFILFGLFFLRKLVVLWENSLVLSLAIHRLSVFKQLAKLF